jgi:hypothetical protein
MLHRNWHVVLVRLDFVLLVCAAAELLELRQQFEDGRKRLAALKVRSHIQHGVQWLAREYLPWISGQADQLPRLKDSAA